MYCGYYCMHILPLAALLLLVIPLDPGAASLFDKEDMSF